MHDSYALGTKPKRPPLTEPLNEKSREICQDVDYLLTYFQLAQQQFTDRSTNTVVKFSIGPNVNLYLNNDAEGTVDLCLTGPGLLWEMSLEDAISLMTTVINT